jgi:hypothetical protein
MYQMPIHPYMYDLKKKSFFMSKAAKGVSLSGILKCLDKIAPLRRAEAWDNGMVRSLYIYILCAHSKRKTDSSTTSTKRYTCNPLTQRNTTKQTQSDF